MNRFHAVLMKLKQWLRNGQSQQVHVRTFAGNFVAQRNKQGKAASYGDYLKYAESSHNLMLAVSDVIQVKDRKKLKHEVNQNPEGTEQFNQTIAGYCLDFARYVVVLRNQMK